jgi:hypothetical protein
LRPGVVTYNCHISIDLPQGFREALCAETSFKPWDVQSDPGFL